MRKTFVTLAATAAIATAGVSVAPRPAHAIWWIAPAIVGAAIAGTAVGATAAGQADRAYAYLPPQPYDPAPAGEVYVRPSGAPSHCHWGRERVPGGWRNVRVCD